MQHFFEMPSQNPELQNIPVFVVRILQNYLLLMQHFFEMPSQNPELQNIRVFVAHPPHKITFFRPL